MRIRPSTCPDCAPFFLDDPLLQAEILFIARTVSAEEAQMELDDRLEETHSTHGRE